MFTGIIETIGEVINTVEEGSNITFSIKSAISDELKIDQSLSHDGVCLTVIEAAKGNHKVTAVKETLEKSNLLYWGKGRKVNLERCMVNNGRFDGHIVQGHVDQTGVISRIIEEEGSWLFTIEYQDIDNITVEKGSITVNGISLTCFNSGSNQFTVAIIPYTYNNTNLQYLSVGDTVNLEFDIIGKYVKKLLNSNL